MMASPLIILMANAVFFGCLAAMMIVIAISVDSWQSYEFDPFELNKINSTSSDYTIQRLSDTISFFKVLPKPASNTSDDSASYLYPSYTGLWKLCDDLTDGERNLIPPAARPSATKKCFTFVTDYNEDGEIFSKHAMQIARLHNSAASCYIVVIIDLVTAAVVGTIGIVRKQVASCMVTGVLYCMAALFGVFGLSMFHTKHYYETFQCYTMHTIPTSICPARSVHVMWAIPLAWIGVLLSVVACTLWLVVARALRVIKAKTML